MEFYFQLQEYFINDDWLNFLFWARIISGAVSVSFIVFIGVIVVKLSAYNRPPALKAEKEAPDIPKKAAKEPWQAILKKLESGIPADWNLAVIQADSTVDRILQEMGLPGETMGDRMKQLDTSRMLSLDDLWEAHRIRNEIVHSPEKTITKHRAVFAISLFEKVLKEMGYLD